MSEKRLFDVSGGERPEFLKLPENREKADAFIQLSDMLVGFSGKAKITNRLFHAMFPSGLGREDRVVRIKLLQQVLKKNPDVVLRTSQDFGMHSTVSVPELHGVDHERRIMQGDDDQTMHLLTGSERKALAKALNAANDGGESEEETRVLSSRDRVAAIEAMSPRGKGEVIGNGEPTMFLTESDFMDAEPSVPLSSQPNGSVPQADPESPTGFLTDNIAKAQREYLRSQGLVPAAIASRVGAERKAVRPAARRESPRSGVRASSAISRVESGSGSHSLVETPDDATVALDRSALRAGLADSAKEQGVNKGIKAKDFFTVPKRDG